MDLLCTITTRELIILKQNESYIQVALSWSNEPLADPDLWMREGGESRIFNDFEKWEPSRFMVKDKPNKGRGKQTLFSSRPVHMSNINGNSFALVILTHFKNKENEYHPISEAPGLIQMLHLVGKDPWRRLHHPRFQRKRNHKERLNESCLFFGHFLEITNMIHNKIENQKENKNQKGTFLTHVGLTMKFSIDEFSKYKSQLNHRHNPRLLQYKIDSPHHFNLLDFIIGSFSKSMTTCEYSKYVENDAWKASLYGIKAYMRNIREPRQKMRIKLFFLPLAMPLDGPEAAEACNETQSYITRRGIRQTVYPRGTDGERFRTKIWKNYHLQTSKKMKSHLVRSLIFYFTLHTQRHTHTHSNTA